jgi:hypothetical protein
MYHDNDICTMLKSQFVAGLLVGTITPVFRMNMHYGVGQHSGNFRGLIRTGVIHHNNMIDHILGNDLVVGLAQSLRSIKRWHNHYDLMAFEHGSTTLYRKDSLFSLRQKGISTYTYQKAARLVLFAKS